MNNDQTQGVDVVAEQQEIVRRYAVQLREAACGGNRSVREGGRVCYELLNECAMELAQITRRQRGTEGTLS